MEITIKINGHRTVVEVSAEVAECMDAGRRKAENLSHERRHWDGREFDEYIIATEGSLSCQYTPEDLSCQQETLDEHLQTGQKKSRIPFQISCLGVPPVGGRYLVVGWVSSLIDRKQPF